MLDPAAAGKQLIRKLADRTDKPVVVAVSRSAVPLGRQIADALHAELDLLPIGRVHLPGDTVPLGAVDEDGHVCITTPDGHAVTPVFVAWAIEEARADIAAQRGRHRRAAPSWFERPLVVVDDLAVSGAGVLVAIRRARREGATDVTVAIGVTSRAALDRITREADRVVAVEVTEHVADLESRRSIADEDLERALGVSGSSR